MGNAAIKNPLPDLLYPFWGACTHIAHLIFNKVWSLYTLGSPDSWLHKLRNYINIILDTKIPVLLFCRADHEKIFEQYYSVARRNEKTFPGFGIGLIISIEIIQQYKNKIAVLRGTGKGSKFYFSHPLKSD